MPVSFEYCKIFADRFKWIAERLEIMKVRLKKIKLKAKQPMSSWKFSSFIEVDKEHKVEGINIWNHYWSCSDRKIEVRSPLEGQVYFFNEYEIKTPGKTISFVAGEFSNGQIGIYTKDELSDNKL